MSETAPAVLRAVNLLIAAGMVLRYTSVSGSSYYLGWPERSGVLRVSDHTTRYGQGDEGSNRIYSRLTINLQSIPKTEARFQLFVARALAQYLQRAPSQCDKSRQIDNVMESS